MGLKTFGFLSKPTQGKGGKAVLTGWMYIGPRREKIFVFPNTYNTRGEGQGMSYTLTGDDGQPRQDRPNQGGGDFGGGNQPSGNDFDGKSASDANPGESWD